jgi:hypothetical protein
MKTLRLGAGALLAAMILGVWSGACNDDDESCGNAGDKSGTCQAGNTCPSGSVEISISDPSDECPSSASGNYVCCQPSQQQGASDMDSGTAPVSTDSGTNG